ncbi:MAG: redoxin domain-containing protein [Thermodesulfobacteriota bacterium]|nr:redoxin domain-containing protein [Thermodesulfobacteriota bacterium]
MKRGLIFLGVAAFLFFLMSDGGRVLAASPPEKGDVLPDINLPVPEDSGFRNYLGLSGKGMFQIPQIKAKVVIVEVFSMYCPHCQREAPEINRFYNIVEKDPDAKSKMKLIGIGAGNSTFEVDVFRKTYKVGFPLFADEDFSIHKSLGEVRTPYFLGVKMKDGGGHEIFYSKLGGFEDAEVFFQQMLKLSGLK